MIGRLVFLILTIYQSSYVIHSKKQVSNHLEEEAVKSRCTGCHTFVQNFKRGLEKTASSNYGQEKADWEPRFTNEKLGSYSASETRLVEVLEGVCDKDYYCNWVASEYEDEIENWYFHKQTTFKDFDSFLCVEKGKLCCPLEHYGPQCKSCASLKCGIHGKCQGSGTRTGEGKCECDHGYTGGRCQKCSPNFYGTNDSTCIICNDACDGCIGPGSDQCVECAKGHIRTILSGNLCINLHKDLPSPSRLQLYLIGIHVVCLFLLTYASYIYKGSGFCKIIFVALLALMLAYHKLYYTKSLGADGYPEQFHDPVITQPGKVN